ncbi:MAG: nucleotidyltransferase domain-containing protein [Deltaproteobacteria bacterium]|nr:nucleotidyltransferase domain-containing protein [Deltaproteobacteria bacterium]
MRELCQSRYGFTGRQLAEWIGYSHTQTMAALDDLESQGLVNRQRAGRAHLFTIVDENIIVRDVLIPAFRVERDLLNTLADMFYDKLGQKLTSVILFGSVARAEEGPESDVDLLVVVKNGTNIEKAENEASDISLQAYSRFGCSISIILVTRSEYDKKLKRKQGFWREIPAEGRKLLPGKERL